MDHHHSNGGPQQILTAVRRKAKRSTPVLRALSFDYCQPIRQENPDSSWKKRLLQVSNVASMLCVVDCTVLPLITIVLSILGLAEQPNRLQWLHAFGHGMAIYFVLPVGSLTTTINFLTHKKLSLTGPALLGLLLIYIANCVMPHCSHGDSHDHSMMMEHDHSSMEHDHSMMGHDHSKMMEHDHSTMDHHGAMMENHNHAFQDPDAPAGTTILEMVNWFVPLSAGNAHRITNVVGCALLLSSNYRAQRLHGCQDKECCKQSRGKTLPLQVY